MSIAFQSLDERAQARLGSTIREKYRLERVLGVGGMATVYEARHRNGHRVALKVLHKELSAEGDIRAKFLREGYVANRVDHPGAVRVLDDDTAEDGAVFLVMELLQGESVDARWEREGRRMRSADVCLIADQVLAVLAVAHDKSIVHRDIKPDNLFVTKDGVVKVLDFGIARLRDPDGDLRTRTQTGHMMGTPAFMPPEQARGLNNEINGRTDLWAVGATMFTLLSGEHVHNRAKTSEEMVIFAATLPARSLAQAAPDVPAPIAAVVDRALAFSISERWPDARAMQRALADAHPGGTVLAPAPTSDSPAASLPRPANSTTAGMAQYRAARFGLARSRRVVGRSAVALLAVLAVAAFGAWAAQRAARVPPSQIATATPPPFAAASESVASATVPPGPSVSIVDVAALPLIPSTAPRSPHPSGAHPNIAVKTAPAAASVGPAPPTCHVESSVEMVRGEPVTRFRRVCR